MRFVVALGFAMMLVRGAASAQSAPEPLSRPDWTGIFSADGTIVSLQGGRDAVFLEDRVSEGLGVDMSVIASTPTLTIERGVIAAANDLANGYVYARNDAGGNLQLYAGVERLDSAADSYVEFEFNQEVVGVRSGVPWPVHGVRTVGDVLVRVDFAAGVLSAATFMLWNGSAFQPVAVVGTDACGGSEYSVCVGAPPQETVQAEVWDPAYRLVQVRRPDSFLEVGLNVASLLGSSVEFTSIQVKTAQDGILDCFRRIGSWARRGQGGGLQ